MGAVIALGDFGMRVIGMLLAVSLVSCTTSPVPASVGDVIAAERAFAERAQEAGWVNAFREFSAHDGVLAGRSGLAATTEALRGAPEGDRNLFWWPTYAGISRSGDLGFTTGGFSIDEARTPFGQYFTMWRREPDGNWKWIYDGGPGRVSDPAPMVDFANDELSTLRLAQSGVGLDAVQQIEALEASILAPADVSTHLAPDAHVYRRGRARGLGGGASRENLGWPSAQASYRLVRVEASTAGDLAFALGEVSWSDADLARSGFFARVWQYREGVWMIVYDQIVERPPTSREG